MDEEIERRGDVGKLDAVGGEERRKKPSHREQAVHAYTWQACAGRVVCWPAAAAASCQHQPRPSMFQPFLLSCPCLFLWELGARLLGVSRLGRGRE